MTVLFITCRRARMLFLCKNRALLTEYDSVELALHPVFPTSREFLLLRGRAALHRISADGFDELHPFACGIDCEGKSDGTLLGSQH